MAKKRSSPDPWLLGIAGTLIFLGILILAGVSASFSFEKFGTTFYFLNHQLLYGFLPGIAVGLVAFFLPLSFIKKWSFPMLLLTIVLLMLVLVPGIGATTGANRWLYLGSFSFQPSELLKLTFILYLASWLASRMQLTKQKDKQTFLEKIGEGKETFLPFIIITGIIGLFLILQPDISTLGVIGLTGVIMYFAAGTPVWHTLSMIAGGIGALFLLIRIAPYRLDRLAVFFDPSLEPLGIGYQMKQALIGIGSGGLIGVGLGLGFQKFGTLPEPISDSIFAIFAEEIGFIGAFLLIMLFLAFAWRSFTIARKIQDSFAKNVLIGVASWITLQALVNMGSITGLLPLTGIPLPFISYGGSALAIELIAIGILLNISKQAS